MKKFFTVKKSDYISIMTFAVIAGVAAFYMLVYVPQSEDRIITQRFRALNSIDKNIHEKIDNAKVTLSKILEGNQSNPGNIKKFINSLPTNEFAVSHVYCTDKSDLSKNNISSQSQQLDSSGNLDVGASSTSFYQNELIVDKSINSELRVLDDEKKFQIVSTRVEGKKSCEVFLTYSFESFIKPLLRTNVFDAYIVLSKNRTVFETFPAGISYKTQDSLFLTKNHVTASTFRSIMIGGIEYKMFLQPVSFNNSNEWIVAGLLKSETFASEIRELPGSWVLALMLFVLIGIMILPWLKLYLMGNREKMNVVDGISSFVSGLLLMSFVFLVFVKYNYSYKPDSTDSKGVLSRQIEANIKSDINEAFAQMEHYDSLVCSNKLYQCDLVNIPARTGIESVLSKNKELFIKSNAQKFNEADKDKLDTLAKYLPNYNISQIIWINESGRDSVNWNRESVTPEKSILSGRSYYKEFKRKNTFTLSDGIAHDFYITQLISPTYNTFRTFIAKGSALYQNSVQLCSFDLKSLINVVMPDGYSFAIINDKGDVLYHADSTRNLNENFFEECSDKTKLISAISSKTEERLESKYYGQSYQMLIRPIKDLPYFIVLMNDMRFIETRDSGAFKFALTMLFILFAFLCIMYYIIFKASAASSNVPAVYKLTEWVLPRHGMTVCYIQSFIANAIAIGLLNNYSSHETSFLGSLFIMILAFLLTALFLNICYWRFYKSINKNRNSMQEPRHLNFKVHDLIEYKQVTLIVLCSMVLIVELLAIKLLENNSLKSFLKFQFFIAIFFCIIYFVIPLIENRYKAIYRKFNNRFNYVRMYSLMAISGLIISSGVPVMLFYTESYNYEQDLMISYKHSLFAAQLINKFDLKNVGDSIITDSVLPAWAGVYVDSSWVRKIALGPLTKEMKSYIRGEDNDWLIGYDLFNAVRLHGQGNELAVSSDDFYKNVSSDSSQIYNANDNAFENTDILKRGQELKGNILNADDTIKGLISIFKLNYKNAQGEPIYLKLKSGEFKYSIPDVFNKKYQRQGLIYWCLLIFVLIVFWLLIIWVVKKIFALEMPNLTNFRSLDAGIIKDAKSYKLLFLIGLPGSGKLTRVMKYLKSEVAPDTTEQAQRFDCKMIDMVFIPDSKDDTKEWDIVASEEVINDPCDCYVINNFDYNLLNVSASRIKLNLLEKLMMKGKRVIILSSVELNVFMDSILEQGTLNPTESSIFKEDYARWNVILGHYKKLYVPLQENIFSEEFHPKNEIERTLYHECTYNHFLKQVYENWVASFRDKRNDFKEIKRDKQASEDLIQELQSLAHHSYHYLWSSLSSEEKFIVYDLAEEGLVNSYDMQRLVILIKKGVIVSRKGSLSLFNNSFRIFVLTSISKQDQLNIKEMLDDEGSWSKFKTPLMVAIIAIMIFLLGSQKEIFNQIIAILGGLAVGIPTIMKFMSLGGSNGGDEKKS